MAILFIIMLIAWAFLAFFPSWIEVSLPKNSPRDRESFSEGRPFMVQAYGDESMANGGPATATLYGSDADEHSLFASRKATRSSLSQISVVPAGRSGVKQQEDLTIMDKDFTLRTGSRFCGNISGKRNSTHRKRCTFHWKYYRVEGSYCESERLYRRRHQRRG